MFHTPMLRLLVAGAAALLSHFAPTAPRAEVDGQVIDGQVIEQRLRDWTDDFNAARAETICDLFAPDLKSNYRGQPEQSFRTLCAGLQSALSDPERAFRYDLDLQEVMVSGDMAVVRLIWHLTVTDRATGAAIKTADRGLDVFRREPDGKWRIARFLAYEIEEE